MKQLASASSDRGSMLPLFLGLTAISLVLSLGIAELASAHLFRQSIQGISEQLALKAAYDKLDAQTSAKQLLVELNPKLELSEFKILDGKTVQLTVCGNWLGWLKLPGLDLRSSICASSASR